MDQRGWGVLHRHGIRTVVDLRSSFEVANDPYEAMIGGIEVRPAALEEGLLDDPEFRQWAEDEIFQAHATTAEATLTALLDGLDASAYLQEAGLSPGEVAALHDHLEWSPLDCPP